MTQTKGIKHNYSVEKTEYLVTILHYDVVQEKTLEDEVTKVYDFDEAVRIFHSYPKEYSRSITEVNVDGFYYFYY